MYYLVENNYVLYGSIPIYIEESVDAHFAAAKSKYKELL